MTAHLDVDEIERDWIDDRCAYCDDGDPRSACTCPPTSPKPVIADLIEEVRRLRGDS